MRILHLPTSVGGNAVGLAEGERALGHDARVISLYRSKFGYDADIQLDLGDFSKARKLFGHFSAFLKYRSGFDIYNHNYGSSFLDFSKYGLRHLDLPFFDKSARHVVTYQGCDARQKYATMQTLKKAGSNWGACFNDDCYNGLCLSGKEDKKRRLGIEKMERHASHFFALNPDLLDFLPREKASFLPYTIASTYDIAIKSEDQFFTNQKIRIAHAPTQRGAKGTSEILAAIEILQEKYSYVIELVLIENTPHWQALSIIQSCDLLLDQALIGWYGGVAVEAASLGVPVASYVNLERVDGVPEKMIADLPFINFTPYMLQEDIEQFITNREMAFDMRLRGLEFVKTWHDPKIVAKQTLAVYSGNT